MKISIGKDESYEYLFDAAGSRNLGPDYEVSDIDYKFLDRVMSEYQYAQLILAEIVKGERYS